MGVTFFEDHGGREVYECRMCAAYLTHDCHFLSSSFNGSHGPAILFSRVTNITFGPAEIRHMVTGPHSVRDLFCKGCQTLMGWYYEYTDSPQQQYKERCFILEVAHIMKTIRNDEKCFHK